MYESEGIREALHIFGLDRLPKSRLPELPVLLKKRYHALAKKVHPDHSGYQPDFFTRLQSHYELLQGALLYQPEQVRRLLPENEPRLPQDNSGAAFFQYKDLVSRYNTAINNYFAAANREGGSLDQEFRNSYRELVSELSEIRPKLTALAEANPQALWVQDVQHILGKLDIWLRESQSAHRQQ